LVFRAADLDKRSLPSRFSRILLCLNGEYY
jgi:hypothetical protein